MKKNNKGFTLIELIAVILIIGSIMALSAPNVLSMIDKNKRTMYIRDAKKMVKLARYKFNNIEDKPTDICVNLYGYQYMLSELDKSDLSSPPNGGTYDLEDSFVGVKYDNEKMMYVYYVQLIEKYTKDGNTYYRGVKYTDSSDLDKENAKMKYVTTQLTTKSQFRSSGCVL